MNFRRVGFASVILGVIGGQAIGAPTARELPATIRETTRFVSRAESAPRKTVIASALADFSGSVAQRLALAAALIDQAATRAEQNYPGQGLDLVVLPEFAICRETGKTAAERAVTLKGDVLDILAGKAREHRTWIVAPMTLREEGPAERISNAAVLLNRSGEVAGIFRKVHPVADESGIFEGGVQPGDRYAVFNCDFGRLGILICWDMEYEEAWDALSAAGAEIVALPTASPQNLRPSAEALRHNYYVVNSAPRDNTTLFDPIGRPVAQITSPGILVHQVDLAYALLHWTDTLHEGRAFTERFGTKVGYDYSSREDTGVFWSNDRQHSIGAMMRELGLHEMSHLIQQVETARSRRGL